MSESRNTFEPQKVADFLDKAKSKNAAYIEHFTRDGDRWDALAFFYYRDVTKQSVLIKANCAAFGGFAVPAMLPAGLVLKVPLIEADASVPDGLLPPWKRGQSRQEMVS